MGHHRFNVLEAHLFLDGPFHPDQADAVLIFDQFPDGAHPTVAEMVNVVDIAFGHAILEVNEILDGGQDVLIAENRHFGRHIQSEFVVHLGTPNIGKIIAFRFKEEAPEKCAGRFRGRRIAGPQTPVYFNDRFLFRLQAVR